MYKILPVLFVLVSFQLKAQIKNVTAPAVETNNNVTNNLSCGNWLFTNNSGSNVKVGDLDISGNQITVEAVINRTSPYSGSYVYAGDIVSKHKDPNDVNYLLRPNSAEITTTVGYYATPNICPIQLNKTYHIALVYDGTTLKFYRNGFLMSQKAATGNLYQNDYSTTINDWASYTVPIGTNMQGFTNEVRIWNVARTQAELRAYMNTSLPSPTTQTGLKAYYTFDNLLNKQGNATWNGTLNGSATINATNTSCTYLADSCNVVIPPPAVDLVINDYTAALSLDLCKNILSVQDATKYNVGDTVLLIQMKGAKIDSSNTANFGNITDIAEAGNYDINYVKSKSGNQVELLNQFSKTYNFISGKVQLVRVPYFQNNLTVTDNLTCQPWNGSTGGILIFQVKDTLKLAHDIDVSVKGFAGGTGFNNAANVLGCDKNEFFYPVTDIWSGRKGESIASLSDSKIRGKGRLAAGGGGGNGHNSGGGGGANGGQGGIGGYQLDQGCSGSSIDNRGIAGIAISTTINATNNKIFLGSGGGAGQADNPGNIAPKGGNGGGIVMIKAGALQSNGFKIKANGENAVECIMGGTGTDCHDGMGGGGAGGTISLTVTNYIGFTGAEEIGGKGGNVSSTNASYGKVGPGGGGGGGVLLVPQAALPATVSNVNTGGQNGVLALAGNISYGASPGTAGLVHLNNNLQFDITPFKKNIDSVRIQKLATGCSSYNFNGSAFTNSSGIVNWQWDFGDGTTATTQNTSHTFTQTGSFIVKLKATDINGCKDSFNITISGSSLSLNVNADTSYCSNTSISRQLNATGSAGTYTWTPAAFLSNPSIANPVATVNATTKFYVTLTDGTGCTKTDSIKLTVNALPTVSSIVDTSICENSVLQLQTSSNAVSYSWTPVAFVSNPAISSPQFTGNSSQVLFVNVLSAAGCANADTVRVTVKPLPVVRSINDTTICASNTLNLNTTGAQTYSWSPATFLTNPTISNPSFTGPAGNYIYVVNGMGANLCAAKDTVSIVVKSSSSLQQPANVELCKGKSVTLDGNNGPDVTYTWTASPSLSNVNTRTPIASPASTTIYSLTVFDPVCNLTQNFQVTATVNPLPNIIASKSNDLSCGRPDAKLSASGAVSYLWTPAAVLNNAASSSPTASPTSTTKFVVTGKDAKGCENKDSVILEVNNANVSYNVPNSFTPNGDGVNDCFSVKAFGLNQNFHLMIFNRYGEKVFETKNYLDCWNGRYNGLPANPGNYVYFLSGKNVCGEVVRKGNLLLIR